jgi:hypothetical protein
VVARSSAPVDSERAKVVFAQVRARVRLRIAAAIWSFGALIPFAVVIGTNGFTWKRPGMLIAGVFGVIALGTWLTSFSSRPEAWAEAFEE